MADRDNIAWKNSLLLNWILLKPNQNLLHCTGCSNICWLLLCIVLLPVAGSSQDSLRVVDSFSKIGQYPGLFPLKESLLHFRPDSSWRQKIIKSFLPDTAGLKNIPRSLKPTIAFSSSKPLLQLGRGYISYNWDYRSGKDSSVLWNNASQHLVSAGFNVVIAQAVPLRVTYLERKSNSAYFRDFRDLRVDVDVQQFRQLRLKKAMQRITWLSNDLHDPGLPAVTQAITARANQFRNLLNDPSIARELIHSRETLIRRNFPDTSVLYRDSVTARAKQFIALYDSLQNSYTHYRQLADSLQRLYREAENKTRRATQLLSGKTLSPAELDELERLYGRHDPRVKEIRQAHSGLRSMALGRTLPHFSSLTLQHVNVNGLNLEYARNNVYAAVAAGIVDFRVRDFLYNRQKPVRQYVYAARIGYGTREKDNIILTYFRGRKQLFGSTLQSPAADIQGVSLAGQFFIIKGVRVYGEIAQSGVPYATSGGNTAKSSIRLHDHSQRAYELGFFSYLPRTQTTAEGHYRHTGLNYQSFNNFQFNATTNSWAFSLTQLFWKRQLSLQAAFRKNDFVNPLVLQRYNTNTVYKNMVLTLRKSKWPVLSLGYLPASQYTAVGNLVYENHYQSFTGTISHQYGLGIARASSLVTFSRFFNDSRDSGLVYYNSTNIFWTQTFQFRLFTATLGVSGMKNGEYNLIVMEEGVSALLFKQVHAGFAVKINNLNRVVNKVGFNATTRVSLKTWGELNMWMEQSYLPSMQNDLFKYESYNIGWTKYF